MTPDLSQVLLPGLKLTFDVILNVALGERSVAPTPHSG